MYIRETRYVIQRPGFIHQYVLSPAFPSSLSSTERAWSKLEQPYDNTRLCVHDRRRRIATSLVPVYGCTAVGGANTRPARAPMGSEQLLEYRVGGSNLDAPFFPGNSIDLQQFVEASANGSGR